MTLNTIPNSSSETMWDKELNGLQEGEHLTLKTASLMNRKAMNSRVPAMNASFFSEGGVSDGEEGETDDVEEALLRAFLLEKAKRSEARKCTSTDDENTATTEPCTTESCTSEDSHTYNSREHKEDARRNSSSVKSHSAGTTKKRHSKRTSEAKDETMLIKKSSHGSRGKKSVSDAKECTNDSEELCSVKRCSHKSKRSSCATTKEPSDHTAEGIKRMSSRESMKNGPSTHRRSKKANTTAPGHSEQRRQKASHHQRSQPVEDSDDDDDSSMNSFYNEALELDEGENIEESHTNEAPLSRRKERSVRGRRTSCALSEVPRREPSGLGRRSSIAGTEVIKKHDDAVTMEAKSASVELRRVTRNPRCRGTGSDDPIKRNIQQALHKCDESVSEESAISARHKLFTKSQRSKHSEAPPAPEQLRVSDAICDAEGDQQDALQRVLRSAKQRRASIAAAIIQDEDSGDDEGEDAEDLAAVRQSIARSAIATTPALTRRRSMAARR